MPDPTDHPHDAEGLSDDTPARLLVTALNAPECGSAEPSRVEALLRRLGGPAGVLQAAERQDPEPLIQPLVAALTFQRWVYRSRCERGEALTSPDRAAAYLAARLRPRGREVFFCLYLDNRHRVIADEAVFLGGLDGAQVFPGVVVRKALQHNAAALIVAHNHPSGVAEPSAADARITERLRDALALVDIRLLDHFVVGDGPPESLARRGLLNPPG